LTARLDPLIESGVVRRATLPAPFKVQVYELTDTGLPCNPRSER
jgi:DNA-binding HxlR family transcriptional regulator